jgi:hypothetical protein
VSPLRVGGWCAVTASLWSARAVPMLARRMVWRAVILVIAALCFLPVGNGVMLSWIGAAIMLTDTLGMLPYWLRLSMVHRINIMADPWAHPLAAAVVLSRFATVGMSRSLPVLLGLQKLLLASWRYGPWSPAGWLSLGCSVMMIGFEMFIARVLCAWGLRMLDSWRKRHARVAEPPVHPSPPTTHTDAASSAATAAEPAAATCSTPPPTAPAQQETKHARSAADVDDGTRCGEGKGSGSGRSGNNPGVRSRAR